MTSHPTGAPAPASRQYTGVPDEHIIAAAHGSVKLGTDVPLGWPQRFVHLVSALIAREADAARTVPAQAADQEVALSEGWIHVPQSLGGLGSPA